MGSGIAEVCARAGLDVLVAESGTDTATTARIRAPRRPCCRGWWKPGSSAGRRDADSIRVLTTEIDP